MNFATVLRHVSNDFKIEFLSQILSDTTDLQIRHSKSELISNVGSGYITSSIPLNNHLSELTLISKSLNESDTLFLQQQRKSTSNVNLNKLSNYGFQILDLKGKSRSNYSFESIIESADSIHRITGNYSFLKFTIPIFNNQKNLAYMRLQTGSSGKAVILEKGDNHWKRKTLLYEWVE